MKILHDLSKRVFDIIFGLIGMIILLPFFLIIAIAIKLDSKGSIIFKQARLGRFGDVFYIYKFRSMVENAENMGTLDRWLKMQKIWELVCLIMKMTQE